METAIQAREQVNNLMERCILYNIEFLTDSMCNVGYVMVQKLKLALLWMFYLK